MENLEIINNAVEYAKRSFQSPNITVGEVAENAGFSLDYFARIFLSHTGFTVLGYINYQRLKKAAVLLRKSEKTVLDIALEVGFESHEGFIKAFKKRYRMTPSEYRRQNQSKTLCLADLSDESVITRFLHENPDMQPLPENAWDELLEHDHKRYAYIYSNAVDQGQRLAAPDGNLDSYALCIGDLYGKPFVDIFCDIPEVAAGLVKRFAPARLITLLNPYQLSSVLKDGGIPPAKEVRTISRYCGEKLDCSLPDGIEVRRICPEDIPLIEKIKCALPIGYARHLLSFADYADPCVREYGVFRGDEIIMIAGCGLLEAVGVTINDSIRFYPIG